MRKSAIPPTTTKARTAGPVRRRFARYALVAALLLVAAAAAVTIAVILGTRSGSGAATTTQATVTPVGPIVLSEAGLKARVAALDQLVYWIGPVTGTRYELKRTMTGDVYVRYLPPGVDARDRPGRLCRDRDVSLQGSVRRGQSFTAEGKIAHGCGREGSGIASIERGSRRNVHVAFPHLDYQVEVYAPRAKAARKLATGGSLTPVVP